MRKKKAPENKDNNSKKSNHCNICDKTIYGSKYHLEAHLYQHKAVKPRFKCTKCPKEFYRTDTYSRHIKLHEGTFEVRSYICDYCERSFVNKRNLLIHLKIHDDDFQDRFRYKCPACNAVYSEQRTLKYHIRKIHYNLEELQQQHIDRNVNESWVETVNKSDVCVKMTQVNNNVVVIKKFGPLKEELASVKNLPLDNWTNIKTESKKDSTEDRKNILKAYYSSVFGTENNTQYSKAICDYCNKEMLKKSLRNHIREKHLKLRKFVCEDCKRGFMRHYQLIDHKCGQPVRQRKRVK